MGEDEQLRLAILLVMAEPRKIFLFDPDAQLQTWNERMSHGEYAVIPSFEAAISSSQPDALERGPSCTIFANCSEAEDYAREQVALHPALRCSIYDSEGFGRQPAFEISGKTPRRESEISACFRRWCGSILFLAGLALVALDWMTDFGLTWPATIGARIAPVGLILLVTEGIIVWEARRKTARSVRPS